LQEYISYIEEATGVPISVVSVGPDREQTLFQGVTPVTA
jgi:adenylosuccinate synthase